MPVRAVSKDQEGEAEVEEHTAEEISIEAGHVRSMLYYFLNQFYDPSLQEPFRNTQLYGVKFDWDLEHNVYTYASVRKMIGRIREYARLLQTDYDNPVLDALKAGFRPGQFDTGYDSYQEQPDRETVIRKNIYVAIAFYAHFCDRMEVMLKNAPQFEFISFMGP